ncbi:RNA-guided pseudouridylation complex pseudouridine synthase subunit Cbf5 [Candidatus Aenigmatarchaeota archaeon]
MKEFLVRSEEIALMEYGRYPGSRSVDELVSNGIIILDKWQGVTSRKVVEIIQKLFSAKKAGHSGTLDPNVSGVLPITLNNACKAMPALQGLDKEYIGIMKLHKDANMPQIKSAMKRLTGVVTQTPPVKSAVARRPRQRHVYSFEMLEKNDKDVLFRVSCQAGTYVRLLCHKVGQILGVGANMAELRRTRVGSFTEKDCITLNDLEKALEQWIDSANENIKEFIKPVEIVEDNIGTVIVKDSAIYTITHGSPLYATGISKIDKAILSDDKVALMSLKGELIGLGTAKMNATEMKRKKTLAVKTDRIIIDKKVYPKLR